MRRARRPRHDPQRTATRNASTVAVFVLQRLQTPTAGTVIGALLILIGGIVDVNGSASLGTLLALGGFGLILKYRILPARRERQK